MERQESSFVPVANEAETAQMRETLTSGSFVGSFAAPPINAPRPEEANNAAANAATNGSAQHPHHEERVALALKYLIGFDFTSESDDYIRQFQLLLDGKLFAPWNPDTPLQFQPMDGPVAAELAIKAGCIPYDAAETRSGQPFTVTAENHLDVARTVLTSGVVSPLFFILATYPCYEERYDAKYDVTFPDGRSLELNMNDFFTVNQVLMTCMRESDKYSAGIEQVAREELLVLTRIWIAMQIPAFCLFKGQPTYITSLLSQLFGGSHISELVVRHPMSRDIGFARMRDLARNAIAIETADMLHVNEMSDEAKKLAMGVCLQYLNIDYFNSALHYIAINCDENHNTEVDGRAYNALFGIMAGQAAEAHAHKLGHAVEAIEKGGIENSAEERELRSFEDCEDACYLRYNRPLLTNSCKTGTFVGSALCVVAIAALQFVRTW